MAPLSWLQLAESDDFLSRNLIDNTYFWIKTRKIQKGFQEPLTISDKVVLRILKKYVIDPPKSNVSKCLNKFMKHNMTQTFLQRYDANQRAEFKKHARKYIEIFQPSCGFELGTTDRYEIKSGVHEACVVARTSFDVDDEIQFLQGTFASLDPSGEENLDKNDFSVFHTTSDIHAKLMLGPSRFVNHNCDPNAKFAPTRSGLKIIAVRKILPGEEITVMYSPSYFGKDNKDCLCATCERLQHGYFDPERFSIPDTASFIEVSSSESDSDNEPDVIMIDSGSESDEKETEDNVRDISSDSESDSSDTPLQIDTDEFQSDVEEGTHRRRQRSAPRVLTAIRSKLIDSHAEPESDVVGGRRLRKREQIKASTKRQANTILSKYPLDKSLDTLHIGRGTDNEIYMKERQINRTLHKLYQTQAYKEGKPDVYDCCHCGVYFTLDSFHEFKKYCPRCTRHQRLYGMAWPETRISPHSRSITLDDTDAHVTIDEYRKLMARSDGPGRRFARHGGIALPVARNPRDANFDLRIRMDSDSDSVKQESRSTSPVKDDFIKMEKRVKQEHDLMVAKRPKLNGDTSSHTLQRETIENVIMKEANGKMKVKEEHEGHFVVEVDEDSEESEDEIEEETDEKSEEDEIYDDDDDDDEVDDRLDADGGSDANKGHHNLEVKPEISVQDGQRDQHIRRGFEQARERSSNVPSHNYSHGPREKFKSRPQGSLYQSVFYPQNYHPIPSMHTGNYYEQHHYKVPTLQLEGRGPYFNRGSARIWGNRPHDARSHSHNGGMSPLGVSDSSEDPPTKEQILRSAPKVNPDVLTRECQQLMANVTSSDSTVSSVVSYKASMKTPSDNILNEDLSKFKRTSTTARPVKQRIIPADAEIVDLTILSDEEDEEINHKPIVVRV